MWHIRTVIAIERVLPLLLVNSCGCDIFLQASNSWHRRTMQLTASICLAKKNTTCIPVKLSNFFPVGFASVSLNVPDQLERWQMIELPQSNGPTCAKPPALVITPRALVQNDQLCKTCSNYFMHQLIILWCELGQCFNI